MDANSGKRTALQAQLIRDYLEALRREFNLGAALDKVVRFIAPQVALQVRQETGRLHRGGACLKALKRLADSFEQASSTTRPPLFAHQIEGVFGRTLLHAFG